MARTVKTITTLLAASLSLIGTAPQKIQGAEATDGEARITLFSSKDMAIGALAPNKTRVYVDGKGTRLAGNRFFTVALPPGRHVISSGAGALIARRERLELDLKPGDHLFILEGLEMGQWRARLALRIVSCTDMEGRNLQAKLNPVRDAEGAVQEDKFPECKSRP